MRTTAVTAAAVLVAGIAFAPTAEASTTGLIAFASNRTTGEGVHNPEGDYEIFSMRADGTGVTQLTDNAAFDFAPSWSGDGRRLAFESTRDGNSDIFTMNADGTEQTNVTRDPAIDSYAAFSPDGRRIAFESSRVTADNPEGDIEIFSIRPDGTRLTQLTRNATFDRQPSWSEVDRIAFSQTVGGVFHVFTMDADGRRQADRSVDGGFFDVAPKWRPDGKRIAFSSSRGGGSGIYTMKANGSGVLRLTNGGAATDAGPSYSPDGRRIAFHSNRGGDFEIYAMSADGTTVVNLSNNPGADFSPVWQPVRRRNC